MPLLLCNVFMNTENKCNENSWVCLPGKWDKDILYGNIVN